MRTVEELEARIKKLEEEKKQKENEIVQLKIISDIYRSSALKLANIQNEHEPELDLPIFNPEELIDKGVSIKHIEKIAELYQDALTCYIDRADRASEWMVVSFRDLIECQPYFVMHCSPQIDLYLPWHICLQTMEALWSKRIYLTLLSCGYYDYECSDSPALQAIKPDCGSMQDKTITEEEIQLTIAMSSLATYPKLSDEEKRKVKNCSLDWTNALTLAVIQSRFTTMFSRVFDNYFEKFLH